MVTATVPAPLPDEAKNFNPPTAVGVVRVNVPVGVLTGVFATWLFSSRAFLPA